MLTIKHPSKPVELRAQYGYVSLIARGHNVGNIADITQLTDEGKQRIIDQGQDPAGFKSLGYMSLSQSVLSWIDDNKQPLIDKALQNKADGDANIAARQKKQDAEDAPHIDGMEKQAKVLADQMPSDHVRVVCTQDGSADGTPIMDYTCDGVELTIHDITIHGIASAIREGALGAFKEIMIASISADDLMECRTRQDAKIAKKEAEQAQIEKELNKPVPQVAINAYYSCGGDPETLHDDIDHPDYWLVKRYSDAIEHQGLRNA